MVSIVGILLGGNLALIAVLQPPLQELRSIVTNCASPKREEAFDYKEKVQKEFRQNFLMTIFIVCHKIYACVL